jgi:dTMP kinase
MTNNNPAYGRFITLEGGEGAGKSTQIKLLAARLENAGKKILITREPGGTKGAEAIRELLVKGDDYKWDSLSQTLLLFSARRDHIKKIILPAMKSGTWVICDRFYDSTFAYQGAALGLDDSVIAKIKELAIGDIVPDKTFILDVPVELGLSRVTVEQHYERLGHDFHAKLRQGFLDLEKKYPQRIIVINAQQDVAKVENDIWENLKSFL